MKTKLYREDQTDEVIRALAQGDIIAFPTDTVFGLACICDNEEAVRRVKEAKKRDAGKPLPMMCLDREMMAKYAVLNDAAIKLSAAFFPGKMTLVLPKREDVPAYMTNGFETVAIRIPSTPAILHMIAELGKPLLVTSANLSGEPSLRCWRDVYRSLSGRIDGILCADADSETASTIVDVCGEVRLIRVGEIDEERIKEALR